MCCSVLRTDLAERPPQDEKPRVGELPELLDVEQPVVERQVPRVGLLLVAEARGVLLLVAHELPLVDEQLVVRDAEHHRAREQHEVRQARSQRARSGRA